MLSLSSLKRGREIKPPIIALYGVHGIGKSSWAAEAPSPVFIQTEEGLNTLDVVKFPLCKSVDEVFQALNSLINEQHSFQTVVIDTLDWFEQLVHREVRRINGDTIFADYGKGYKFSIPYFNKLIDTLTFLRDAKNMSIIVIGHAKIFQFNAPDLPAHDRYALDLHESIAPTFEEWADCVFFTNYKVYVTKEDVGFGKQEGKATGKGDRVLFTQERPSFRAKNRYHLPLELPMNYPAFLRGMKEGLELSAKKPASPPASEPVAPVVA